MQYVRVLAVFWLFFSTVGSSSALTAVAEATDDALKAALATLSASNAAWRRNDAEFRALRQQNGVSPTDIDEFAEFVAGQQRQMLEDCQAVRELGTDPAQHGFDCHLVEREAATTGDQPVTETAVLTEQEKDAALDKELRKLEADLDKLVLGQQQQVRNAARRRDITSTGSGSGSADGEPASGGTESGASGGNPRQGSERGRNKVDEQGAGPGAQKNTRNQPAQENVPKNPNLGDDDDVVARQLREAAEAETDPVLKKKLWAEYKRYKASKG